MGIIQQTPDPNDISMVFGDDLVFTIHSPIDLTGATLSAKVGTVSLTIAASPGLAAGYYYDVIITAAQSAAFVDGQSWYLLMTDPASKKRTLITGVVHKWPAP